MPSIEIDIDKIKELIFSVLDNPDEKKKILGNPNFFCGKFESEGLILDPEDNFLLRIVASDDFQSILKSKNFIKIKKYYLILEILFSIEETIKDYLDSNNSKKKPQI